MAKGKVGLGRRGEALAAEALARHGFTVVDRNWRCRTGEVDLVARRADEWYFVEVRTRRGTRYGTPETSISPRKRARMEAVARRYLADCGPEGDVAWHLSLVAVAMDAVGRLQRITLYPDLDGDPWELSR
jgi:putative endonuclease